MLSIQEKLIITQGSEGVRVGLKDGSILKVPARKAKVVDTTGAGDTLNGAFAVRMACGDSLKGGTDFCKYGCGPVYRKDGCPGRNAHRSGSVGKNVCGICRRIGSLGKIAKE